MDLAAAGRRSSTVKRREFIAGAASLVLAPRSLARAASRAPLALVTADRDAKLVAVDLSSGAVHVSIPTLPYPRSIETVGSHALVAHSEIGALTVIDAQTLRATHVIRGLREPRYTAAHPDGRHAFVTDATLGEVVCVDVLRGRIVGREFVGVRARHITTDPRARRLWIALGSKAARIAVVDVTRPSRPRLVRSFAPPFLAHDVAWAPTGGYVWVTSGDRAEIIVYAARTGRLVRVVSADAPPQHVTFAGETAFVSSGWSGTMRIHDVRGRPRSWTAVPVGSYNVQQGEDRVVTPSLERGTISILDERGRLLRTRRLARSCHDACVTLR
jgi:DNA-binding beta-propeller fold protein YncE